MKSPSFLPVALAASVFVLGARSVQAEDSAAWSVLKSAWAKDHLKLADELLQAGSIGFADTQAGLAEELSGAENAGVKAYKTKRLKTKLPDKGWVESDWKAYEAKRCTLHVKEASQAAAFAAKEKPAAAAEIEAWALRLDPDQADIRKRRGEEKLPALGWLPLETATQLKAGKVRFAGAWEMPEAGKYSSWDKACSIPSEHFLLRTTLPREQILGMIASLEAAYRNWEEAFEGLVPLWGRKELPEVWVLRTLADYEACVKSEEPSILERAMVRGMLGIAVTSKAFFREEAIKDKFISASFLIGVASHECSHLIHRGICMGSGGDPGKKGTLWNSEGLAMLMESIGMSASPDWNVVAGQKCSRGLEHGIGALDSLPDLFGMDANAFNADMVTHYEQSFILAHFLMYGQGGAHRREFLASQLAIQKGDSGDYDSHYHQLPLNELCALAKAYAPKLPR